MRAILPLYALSLGILGIKTGLSGSLAVFYKVLVADDSTALNYFELRHLAGRQSTILQTSLVQIPSTGFESVVSVGAVVYDSMASRQSVRVEIPVLAEGEPFADTRSLEAVKVEGEEFVCLDQLVKELEKNSVLFGFEAANGEAALPQKGLLPRIEVDLFTKSLLYSCVVRMPPDSTLAQLGDAYTDLEF